MRKLVLLGLSADRARLIKQLQRTQLVEVKVAEGNKDTSRPVLDDDKEAYVTKMARIASALSLLNQGKKLDKKLSPVKLSTKEKIINLKDTIEGMEIVRIGIDEFSKVIDKEKELFDVMTAIEDFSVELNVVKSDRAQLLAEIAQLSVYKGLEVPFSNIKDTKHTFSILGTIAVVEQSVIKEIEDLATLIYPTDNKNLMFVTGLNDNKAATIDLLARGGFVECPFDYDVLADDKIKELEGRVADNKKVEKDLAARLAELDTHSDMLKRLYDFYDIEVKKLEAAECCQCTASCFVLEGWLPISAEAKVDERLKLAGSVIAYEFLDPVDGETVPTLVKNSKLVEPYQSVTNMYSPPSYKEMEPNFFVAIFFFIYFGMMMSDAGYGIILALATTIILFVKKPKRGEMNLVKIILMGGISTIVWGVVFGGWFGITLTDDGGIGSFLLSLQWFNPLEDPLMMMILSVGLGFAQILVGLALNFVNLIKAGQIVPAVGEVGGWYAIFGGIGLLAVNMLLVETAIPAINITAYCLFGLGFIGLTAASAYGKKGILRFFGGLGKLYNITGFLSDILSYTRLFGLGLCTGVVGLVANKLGEVIISLIPYAGYVIAAAVLVFMHTFNIAINTLGAYVHNCRLQFIEFFGRFYVGEGHIFQPLGGKTKYTNLEY